MKKKSIISAFVLAVALTSTPSAKSQSAADIRYREAVRNRTVLTGEDWTRWFLSWVPLAVRVVYQTSSGETVYDFMDRRYWSALKIEGSGA